MELYNQIESAIRNYKSSLSVPDGTGKEQIHSCIRNIMRKNPDIFWFSHQWEYIKTNNTIHFYYTISKEKSEKAKKQIEDVIQNDFNIKEVFHLSVTERIMYVYKWIALYCKYNIYSAYNQSIYSVFVYRNSVCTGYAKAAQYLLKLLGIESKLVFGTIHQAEKGSRHCWLLVKINSNWYHCDPTFADPEIDILMRKAGVEPVYGTKGLVYNYFCCDTDTIKHSRVIEDENELPTCTSSVDYKAFQDISIHLYRNEESLKLGTKGCLLSEVGCFSKVYLWHYEKGPQSVIKVYNNDVSHNLLHHELRIMQQLSPSPHVLHALEVKESEDGIVIEQATPLADLLCSHYYQLSAINFCTLLLDVLAGLQDCIKYGIYYRDIHLNNIYRTSKGKYVLGDFGSCIWIDSENATNNGGIGSPWYSAPETYLKGFFNEQSATYGVGMLAFFLLNELLPPLWYEYGKQSLYHRVHGQELPSPKLLEKPSCAFEQQLSMVIRKSLSFKSVDRYQHLIDLENAIKQCISSVDNDDYLLISGGSSERLFIYDRKDSNNRHLYNAHTDFHTSAKLSLSTDFQSVETKNSDLFESDNEGIQIEILGVEQTPTDLSEDAKNSLVIDGTSVVLVDIDSDSTYDIMSTDINGNGSLEQDEIVDIWDSQINMEDFARTAGNPFGYAESDDDFLETPVASYPSYPSKSSYGLDSYINDRINDFASTAIGPMEHSSNRRITYNPQFTAEANISKDSPKKSIWSKMFGKGKKEKVEDKAYSSVFAPAEVKRKSRMVVQVYLHLLEETEQVISLAKEAQKDAIRRDYIPLQCKLKRGDNVDVQLNIYGESLLLSEKKSLAWQGSFTKCSFDYFVPKDIDVDELCCIAFLTVNSAQVGEMRFVTQIVEQPKELHPEVFARQYKKIFISYAHQDESKVKYIARAYDAQGVDYFFDRHYLKPGDIFPLKIKEYIDSADLFILCWSANAAQSDYVDLERRQALERAFPKVKPFEEAPLSIYPMSIEPRADLPIDMRDTYNFEVI